MPHSNIEALLNCSSQYFHNIFHRLPPPIYRAYSALIQKLVVQFQHHRGMQLLFAAEQSDVPIMPSKLGANILLNTARCDCVLIGRLLLGGLPLQCSHRLLQHPGRYQLPSLILLQLSCYVPPR